MNEVNSNRHPSVVQINPAANHKAAGFFRHFVLEGNPLFKDGHIVESGLLRLHLSPGSNLQHIVKQFLGLHGPGGFRGSDRVVHHRERDSLRVPGAYGEDLQQLKAGRPQGQLDRL